MKRYFSSTARLVLLVIFTCIFLAITTKFFGEPSSRPVLAALHNPPASPYHNVIVVAKSGGDFTSVQKALNSITDNSPINHYLIWVAPGIYNETVTMKQYVDIEGAGEMATRIINTTSGLYGATLLGASNAELRYLTVESKGFIWTTAISNANASPSLLHVTAISSPSTSTGTDTGGSSPDIYQFFGIHNTGSSAPVMADVTVSNTVPLNGLGYGIYNDNSSPSMKNVTISIASGNIVNYGVYNDNTSATMKDVTISASGGTGNYGLYNNNSSLTMKDVAISSNGVGVTNFGVGSVTIDDSSITTPSTTIYTNPSSVTRIGTSKLEGGPVSGGPVTCAAVYDENYTFYPNTCP